MLYKINDENDVICVDECNWYTRFNGSYSVLDQECYRYDLKLVNGEVVETDD